MGQLTPLHDPATERIYGGPAALSSDGKQLARFQYVEDQGFKVNLTDLASGQTMEIATVPAERGKQPSRRRAFLAGWLDISLYHRLR